MTSTACVTTATLSTESHVRLTVAASLLSTASTASASDNDNNTSIGPSLPPLPHIIPAVRLAVDSDPFWGPDYWSYLFSRASQLSVGIQALIVSLVDLESLVAAPSPTATAATTLAASGGNHVIVGGGQPAAAAGEEKGVRLRKSKLARRQLRMKGEEVELMRRCALQCWGKVVVPSQVRAEVLGLGLGDGLVSGRRTRSLTCP